MPITSYFFFFQAEDGIRDLTVTGVQTCALPIYTRAVQTAEIFADALDYSKQKIRRSELLLPGAEPTLLFRELARDKQASSIFLFGHAPHLDDVIATEIGRASCRERV